MEWLTELPKWAQDLLYWTVNGGGVALLTWLFTQLRVKARSKQIRLEAKDEQVEALIQSQLDLKRVNYYLAELVVLQASGSKINAEEREKMMGILTVMRKEHNLKLDQSVIELVEEAKIRIAERKKREIEKVEEKKSAAEDSVNKLGAFINEVVSKEITKNSR